MSRRKGWRGFDADDPDLAELPELVWYCPICAELELAARQRPARAVRRAVASPLLRSSK